MVESIYTVKSLQRDRYHLWDQYVRNHAEGTFFHLSGWKEVLECGLGHQSYFFYVEKDEQVCGVLPLGHVKSRLFSDALISIPFGVYGGILSDNESVFKLLQQAAEQLALELNVDYLELRNMQPKQQGWPTKDLYVTFRKTLEPEPEQNMLAIPRKQRAMVRKGINAGLQGEIDVDIERFYPVYAESVRNLGTPVFPKKYFQMLFEVFNDDCEVLTVTKDAQAISVVMSFYFRDEVLPYYGGGTDAARKYKANDFKYWELMRRSCEKGIRIFDYGRSKLNTGSYSFKKNWGFVPEPLHYQFYLVKSKQLPDINPLNPKYQYFINAWKRLPLPVANVVGPFIAKNLG